ncbi:MAG: PspC domain-containing protein [Propionibacteriaceae bacterium]|nr:PspC domain-containing protein [Propionibacteriaceae bacterium]
MSETGLVKAPSAFRVLDRALVAGVAAGLSAHSRIPVWVFRAVFVLASGWKFSGAFAYAMLWVMLPLEARTVPIGLVAAERSGKRPVVHKTRWRRFLGWIGAIGLGLGMAIVIGYYDTSRMGRDAIYICVLGLGIAFVWLTRETMWPRWGKTLVALTGVLIAWASGTVIVARIWEEISGSITGYLDGYLGGYEMTAFVALAAMAACGVGFLPWIIHPQRTEEEKQAELIAQTRADMAAHLHDSVLQTLAVIQKQATDAKAVAQLARRQEKDLREWLYTDQAEEESVVTALKEVISELEAVYPVAVELVTVGDHEMTVEIDAIVRAAREAILNAAKHSGADKVDVYAEISGQRAEVFVRDRGQGFKVDAIGEDRMGIRRSIIDRMSSYGGHVDVRSTVGEGTEIRLSMPLDQEGSGYD